MSFISETDQVPTKIDYPIINHPITDYSAVQECLRVSKNASREVSQKHAVTTFDSGMCMKAYPITWKNPDFYDDHIVMIASFHLFCAYLKTIGKKMNESGLADVLLKAGVMFVSTMNGVMSSNNYSHAINCHKALAGSLERLLLGRYLETSLKDLPGDLLHTMIILFMRELLKTWMLQCKTKHLLIFFKNIFHSSNRFVVDALVKLPNLG